MTHYHLAFGNHQGQVYSQVYYDNYEESLVDMCEFAQTMFSNFADSATSLSYGQALEATDHGEGSSAVVGGVWLCIYWVKCESCFPPQLN
jgi:hypothetical protein